jgi:probable F420-dependent oxidoreductase
MPTAHPFRFGVQASSAPSRSAWTELARRAQGQGYDVLTMPDHFSDQLAPVPALMAAADATTALRVGALVWDNDFKHPVVLAKELATMDLLSDGRVEVGIGAGWMVTDYQQAGLAYDRPGVRIDRLVEAVTIMKALFAEGPCNIKGEHYTIDGLDGRPKPVQQPHPPFLIGGGGQRFLGVAARHADIVGVNPTLSTGAIGPEAISTMTAAAVDEKIGWVRDAAGDRLAEVELNIRVQFVTVTDDPDTFASGIAGAVGFTTQQVLESPYVLTGPVPQLVDTLLARRERWGFSYVIVTQDAVDAFAPVVAALAGR